MAVINPGAVRSSSSSPTVVESLGPTKVVSGVVSGESSVESTGGGGIFVDVDGFQENLSLPPPRVSGTITTIPQRVFSAPITEAEVQQFTQEKQQQQMIENQQRIQREIISRQVTNQREQNRIEQNLRQRIAEERKVTDPFFRKIFGIGKQEDIVKSVLFGERGRKILTVPIFTAGPGTTKGPTFTEVKQSLDTGSLGVPGQVVGELFPTTPAELIALQSAAIVFPTLPALAQIGIGATITGTELKKAVDPTLPLDKRIASGTIAGLSGFGTLSTLVPYVKGGLNRLSTRFSPTETTVVAETFSRRGQVTFLQQRAGRFNIKPQTIPFVSPKAPFRKPGTFIKFEKLPGGITVIREVGSVGDITIIPRKYPNLFIEGLPKTSPLRKGAFNVKPGDKILFLGKNQKVGTSQISFFKNNKDIVLSRDFFVSPQEPTLNLPLIRESRLGLINFLDSQKNPQIRFGLPRSSQIGIESGAGVTRTGAGNTFKIGSGSELEGIKGIGTTITNVQKVGVTTISGQGVDIFTFKTVRTPGTIPTITDTSISSIGSSLEFPGSVSGELTLGTIFKSITGVIRDTSTTQTTTTTSIPSVTVSVPQTFRPTGPTKTTTFSSPISSRTTTRGTSSPFKPSSPTTTTTRISTPSLTTSTPSLPTSPISPPLSPPGRTTTILSPPTTTIITPPLPPGRLKPFKRSKKTKISTPRFTVFVRRGGIFKPIATTRTSRRAFSIGRGRVSRTLAATFKVQGKGVEFKTPKGFKKKKTKKGTLFIEQPKFRLSKKSEVKEIQLARGILK